jgi:putative ABC transport system permease protein
MIKIIKIALKDVFANKVRSFLTVLGILIGISSVTMMVSIGGSAQEYINQSITSRLGKNLVMVQPGKQSSGAGGFSFSLGSIFSSLDDSDYLAIKKMIAGTSASVSRRVVASLPVTYGKVEETALTFVIDPEYFKIVDVPLITGRYFRAGNENSRNIIIGESLQKKLFKLQDPLGRKLSVQGFEYTIVGVVEDASGGAAGESFEIYIDVQTYRNVYRKGSTINVIMIGASEDKPIPEFKDQLEKLLRKERRIIGSEESDFTITTQEDIIKTSETILGTVTLFISVISAISLVVGGIGVMNIMLVSVKERVKEIGLRKAIGATNQDIQTQILVESVLFSLIGGILGIMFGAAGALAIEKVGGLPYYISVNAIVLSLGVSSMVGIVFGLYPAIQAGKLSPIEALRSN